MEQPVTKRCYFMDKDVVFRGAEEGALCRLLEMRGNGNIGCSGAEQCEELEVTCRWVNKAYGFDGTDPQNQPLNEELRS